MIKSSYKYLILGCSIIFLWSCANKRILGDYRNGKSYHCPHIIHFDSDSTGYYTWWTDIRMKNNGTWYISNDTIFFTDYSLIHQKDRILVIKKNKLIDHVGREYKKIEFYSKKNIF